MELTQLRYFMTAARLQHITRAAQLLHIAQPALTKSLHKLEQELQVPLFIAKGRNVELTQYGLYFYEHLRQPLETLESLPDCLRGLCEENSRTVRINVLSASTVVTQAIIAYKQQNDAHFIVMQNDGMQQADIYVDTREQTSQPDARGTCVFTEEICMAVPAGSAYAAQEQIALSQLAGAGFICMAGSKNFRGICDRLCRQQDFLPRVIFESDNPTAVRNLIAVGSGVGFWPRYTWGDPGADVKLLRVESAGFLRQITVSCPGWQPSQSAASGFYSFLCDRFAQLLVAPQNSPRQIEPARQPG